MREINFIINNKDLVFIFRLLDSNFDNDFEYFLWDMDDFFKFTLCNIVNFKEL